MKLLSRRGGPRSVMVTLQRSRVQIPVPPHKL